MSETAESDLVALGGAAWAGNYLRDIVRGY